MTIPQIPLSYFIMINLRHFILYSCVIVLVIIYVYYNFDNKRIDKNAIIVSVILSLPFYFAMFSNIEEKLEFFYGVEWENN